MQDESSMGLIADGEAGFFVKFWGTRGSIPTPGFRTRKYGGNTSCIEIRIDGTLLICDGGTGLRDLGVALGRRHHGPIVAHMFFSHPHWDHIQGFPFFQPVYRKENAVFIYGVTHGDERIYRLLSGQMRSDYFPVSFSELGASIEPSNLEDQRSQIDGVLVRTFQQHHPGSSLGFSFEKNGYRVVYATDNELDAILENTEEIEGDPKALRRPRADFLDFIRDADLLIADGQYTDVEYPAKVGWGHARASTVVDAAVLGNVKQLAVFHHDPMQSDQDVDMKIALCRRRAEMHGATDLVIFGAREGLELRIDR